MRRIFLTEEQIKYIKEGIDYSVDGKNIGFSINSKQEYKQLIVTITDKGLEETPTEN